MGAGRRVARFSEERAKVLISSRTSLDGLSPRVQ